MTWQLRLGLGLEDEWPDRLPPGAACHGWFLPPVSWPQLYRNRKEAALNKEEQASRLLVPEQSSLLVQEQP